MPASWSPDGKQVVYPREKDDDSNEPQPLWSRNPKFELYGIWMLPAVSPDGDALRIHNA